MCWINTEIFIRKAVAGSNLGHWWPGLLEDLNHGEGMWEVMPAPPFQYLDGSVDGQYMHVVCESGNLLYDNAHHVVHLDS